MSDAVHEQQEELIVERSILINWLGTIKRDFDPQLLPARNQFPANGWVGSWLIRSLLGLNYKKMSEDSVDKVVTFFSNNVTVWGSIAVGLFGTVANAWLPWFSHIQPWPRTIGIIITVLSLALSLKANFTRMLTLDDPYFNPNAYKLFRPKEYFMFINYFKGTYDFETVYKCVELLYKENSLESLLQEHKAINSHLQSELQRLKNIVEEHKNGLEDADSTIASLNKKIELLVEQVTINEQGFNTAIDVLYRLRKGDPLFKQTDLSVVTAFSLFELEGEYLYRICEHGTTETPRQINTVDPEFAHYSSVKLVKSEKTIEYATSDREGRIVASYWIDMPSGRVLIYNFHFDSTKDGMRDIIESKEMYRFIRVICIHLEERKLLHREGERHAETEEVG